MGLLDKLFGEKPNVPELSTSASKAIGTNINLMPQLEILAEAYNSLSQESMNKQFEQAVPGFSDYLGETRDITRSLLSGQYPETVQKAIEDQVNRTTSASNFGLGVANSPFGTGRLALNRGQIPLNAFQTGLSALERWVEMGRRRLAPSLNLGAFMISPEMQFNRDYQQNVIKAAPDPGIRGVFDTGMSILGMALSAYSGGPGYTNTYRPQYSQTPLGGQPSAQPPPSNVYSPSYPVTPLPNTSGNITPDTISDPYKFGMF